MADGMTPNPNLIEQYAKSVQERKLEAEAQMQKLMRALDSRRNLPFDPMLMRVAGALLQPTKTGGAGESIGYAATAAADEAQRQALQNTELAKMEFELSQKQQAQKSAMDQQNFAMQYFAGKRDQAVPVAPVATEPPLTTNPPIEARPLTDKPQRSTFDMPALLPEDMPPVAIAPAATAETSAFKPRFSSEDLGVLGIFDKDSFALASKINEQELKRAELAANERTARAKEREQELKENSINVHGTVVPFTKDENTAIKNSFKTNNIDALNEIFRDKGIESPFVLRNGKVAVRPQKDWIRDQKAAENLGMITRPIRGKDYEMTTKDALDHDAAKSSGRDAYKSWVNNFFKRESGLDAAPTEAVSSDAAPSSVGEKEIKKARDVELAKSIEAKIYPTPFGNILMLPEDNFKFRKIYEVDKKAGEAFLRGIVAEDSTSAAGDKPKIITEERKRFKESKDEEVMKLDVKQSSEQATLAQQRATSAMELKEAIDDIDSRAKSNSKVFGLLQKPGVAAAIARSFDEGSSTVKLSKLAEYKLNRNDLLALQDAANAEARLRNIIRKAARIPGEGTMSNLETTMQAALALTTSMSPEVVRIRAEVMRERAVFDEKVFELWSKYKKSEKGYFQEFLTESKEYKNLKENYEKKLEKIRVANSEFFSKPKTTAAPSASSRRDAPASQLRESGGALKRFMQ